MEQTTVVVVKNARYHFLKEVFNGHCQKPYLMFDWDFLFNFYVLKMGIKNKPNDDLARLQ